MNFYDIRHFHQISWAWDPSRKMRFEKSYTMMGNNFSTHGLNVELWPKYVWKWSSVLRTRSAFGLARWSGGSLGLRPREPGPFAWGCGRQRVSTRSTWAHSVEINTHPLSVWGGLRPPHPHGSAAAPHVFEALGAWERAWEW